MIDNDCIGRYQEAIEAFNLSTKSDDIACIGNEKSYICKKKIIKK